VQWQAKGIVESVRIRGREAHIGELGGGILVLSKPSNARPITSGDFIECALFH